MREVWTRRTRPGTSTKYEQLILVSLYKNLKSKPIVYEDSLD
jgi:hypothetical protein